MSGFLRSLFAVLLVTGFLLTEVDDFPVSLPAAPAQEVHTQAILFSSPHTHVDIKYPCKSHLSCQREH